ncbi:MAG TPA: hypothetical protein VFH25_08075 [Nitrososphaeraceae archaeon]|nr:hypothetical protein [Nitrososphaeraceae archaeon]
MAQITQTRHDSLKLGDSLFMLNNMGWSQMHWEKIPGQRDKEVLRKQLEDATKEDIPVRLHTFLS